MKNHKRKLIGLLVTALTMALIAPAVQASTAREYAVKAAYLFKFMNLVEWPDETQFDPDSPYFDPKASRDAPRWQNVDVAFVAKTRLVGLAELRAHPELADLRVLARGNRLSITPVTNDEWRFILCQLLDADPDDVQ